ncbi:MAG: TonB-dependent receptor domain-containing protein [Flavobacteriales bacterium]
MKNIVFYVSLVFGTVVHAQIKGVVQGVDSTHTAPLKNVKITLVRSGQTVYSNEDGTFEIILGKQSPDTLLFQAKGYRADRLVVTRADRFAALNVVLVSGQLVQEIVVSSQKYSHGISKMKTLHVEELTSAEFRKAACCNLSESFETNATVDVSMADAISGAKKIQLLGLDAVYTQLQMENIPFLRGLESSFGLNSIPGTWLESIQITKGTGSVVNGYESMAGLVNLEFKKPAEMPKMALNIYQNRFGRSEINLHSGAKLTDKWHMGTFLHGATIYGRPDHNHDGFLDQTNGQTFSVLQRFSYQGKNMEAQLGLQAYADQKNGGQTSYTQASPTGYGMQLESKHLSLFSKTGFFGKKPGQSVGVIANLKFQDLQGFYGLRAFQGSEKRAYFNLIYDDIIGSADHKIKAGASFLGLMISQYAAQTDGFLTIGAARAEWVPGVFAEYSYSGNRLSAVAGARYDLHNLAGSQFSPRVHLKYALTPQLDLRITAGRAWRLPNFVADNLNLLASSNYWQANQSLQPEISWNTGISLTQGFSFKKRKGSLSLDAYHTRFAHQLVADRDTLLGYIVFKNVAHASVATVIQAEFTYEVWRGLDWRFAYKFQDVRSLYAGQLQTQVLLPRQRFFSNLAYRTRNKRWEYDLTYSRYAAVRLPHHGQGKSWGLLNAQITRSYKQLEIYLGGENLLNFTQAHPIMDPENPFGPQFDATQVWGPIMGWNAYFGLRYTLK